MRWFRYFCIVLYCIVLYCIVLYCIVLYCIVLYCIVLYCIVLYCIVLYCIVLYCIVLYCIENLFKNTAESSVIHCYIKIYKNGQDKNTNYYNRQGLLIDMIAVLGVYRGQPTL